MSLFRRTVPLASVILLAACTEVTAPRDLREPGAPVRESGNMMGGHRDGGNMMGGHLTGTSSDTPPADSTTTLSGNMMGGN